MKRRRTRLLLTAVLAAGLLLPSAVQSASRPPMQAGIGEQTAPYAAATADQLDGKVAIEWFRLLVRLAKSTPGFSPPVAARAYGYMGITLYEAIVPGMPGYQSLAGQLVDMPEMPTPPADAPLHWGAVANAALATMMLRLFPAITPDPLIEIRKLERQIAARLATAAPPEVLATSQAHGRAVAEAIFAWSKGDGGHEAYLRNFTADFVMPEGEGIWAPTPPRYAPPLQPTWGDNRTFAPAVGDECAAAPPIPYSTERDSAFYAQAKEVYDTVRTLSEEQRDIAEYWGDDAGVTATPPGHSLAIATQVLRQERASLALAAETYAKIGMALADSFVACWKTKFQTNVPRPITYIQQHIDANWNDPDVSDPLITPPFPEYTSGHSVEAQAAADILTSLFGENYRFTDATHTDLGMPPRTYPSFAAFAQEAAISRLYGGIHYRYAIEQGMAQGSCVAERVLALAFGVR